MALPVTSLSAAPIMPKGILETRLHVHPDTVWGLIACFPALPGWHSGVRALGSVGDTPSVVRRLALPGGGTVTERLEQVADDERRYRFSIAGHPRAPADWIVEIRVRDNGDGTSTVRWSGSLEPAGPAGPARAATVQDFYKTGFDQLRRMFGE